MVIGDPHKFSFMIDIIDDWSSNGFISGLFYLSISGNVFPKELVNTTLNSELYIFFQKNESSLLTKPINNDLFKKNKFDAYKELYSITFPEDIDEDNNYIYSCRFGEIENNSCYIFSVSNGEFIRILGANVDDIIHDEEIKEIYISISELDTMIAKLRMYYDTNICT
ncbi:Imm42 family immunity protein [Vibrio gazogenes]|uniref:Immunity protein 42 n=1 Tax=Vibrio gazogenes DSM 21264 = NBRC 103151 TaxID=1123492 RepID=A0A1M5A4F2_VIBGA|nr:Imm42 family immunity protein [Vibrio gazogenes]USP13356.1 immunity 42 family protein [Vibrio gazogenes]SHF25173.1 Immunity protein 42 [Vibrio gazogenes DSM 21264] [Vibrio gazogenes DSM 21264 = NBRC 103151]SJN57011.1 hypothetical protein BQ6471_02330 [Vibrio gazogenes]